MDPQIDIFSNPQLVMVIKRIKQVLHLSTNLVFKINQIQAIVPYYGKMWYDYKAIENIFSLTNLVKKYGVKYESHQDDSFTVYTNIGIIKFIGNKLRLYVFNTPYTTANYNVVIKLEEYMVGFTSRQIERSKLASKIYSNEGLPTVKNFKHMVSNNTMSEFTISVAAIINFENIYGT